MRGERWSRRGHPEPRARSALLGSVQCSGTAAPRSRAQSSLPSLRIPAATTDGPTELSAVPILVPVPSPPRTDKGCGQEAAPDHDPPRSPGTRGSAPTSQRPPQTRPELPAAAGTAQRRLAWAPPGARHGAARTAGTVTQTAPVGAGRSRGAGPAWCPPDPGSRTARSPGRGAEQRYRVQPLPPRRRRRRFPPPRSPSQHQPGRGGPSRWRRLQRPALPGRCRAGAAVARRRRRRDGGRRRVRGGQSRRCVRPGALRAAAAGPGTHRQRGVRPDRVRLPGRGGLHQLAPLLAALLRLQPQRERLSLRHRHRRARLPGLHFLLHGGRLLPADQQRHRPQVPGAGRPRLLGALDLPLVCRLLLPDQPVGLDTR